MQMQLFRNMRSGYQALSKKLMCFKIRCIRSISSYSWECIKLKETTVLFHFKCFLWLTSYTILCSKTKMKRVLRGLILTRWALIVIITTFITQPDMTLQITMQLCYPVNTLMPGRTLVLWFASSWESYMTLVMLIR